MNFDLVDPIELLIRVDHVGFPAGDRPPAGRAFQEAGEVGDRHPTGSQSSHPKVKRNTAC